MDLPMTFTIPELATMMRSDRRTVRRMLERHGVPISGERYGFVWLADLVKGIPSFKESLELRTKASKGGADDDQEDDDEEPRASSRDIARPRRAPARDL